MRVYAKFPGNLYQATRKSNQMELKKKLYQLSTDWDTRGRPTRELLTKQINELEQWKQKSGAAALWDRPLLMLTATVDDAIGQGLDIIEMVSVAMGMRVRRLGLMMSAEQVIAACRDAVPDLLGLTVLQFDSEEIIIEISESLPHRTRLIAGGPVFLTDREFQHRCGIDMVAKNAGEFIRKVMAL